MSNRHNGGPPLEDDGTATLAGGGWVAITRGIRNHHVVGFGNAVEPADPARGFVYSRAEAWIDLIMECRYKDGAVINGGRRMELRAGELVGARSWLAHRWNWTPKTVRVFLSRLESEGMAMLQTAGKIEGQQKGQQAAVISICNYLQYQPWQVGQGPAEGPGRASKDTIRELNGTQPGQQKGQQIFATSHGNQTENSAELHAQGPAEGPAKGQQRASDHRIWGQIYNKDSKQEESNPPTPLEFDLDDVAARRSERGKRAAQTAAERLAADAEIAQAFEVYNMAARHWGFAECDVLSEARRKRLANRLSEVGGIESFRRALRAVGRDDFLMGRVPARSGQQPFRLNIDRLLQTDGGLGDVLARLIESGDAADTPQSPNGKPWGWWREHQATFGDFATYTADYWRRRLADVKPNGAWPWWLLGAPPGHAECIVHPDVVAEYGLADKYGGQPDCA